MAKPNILLITTDQQRYDTTGPLAPSFMRTPHFDLLRRQGVTFSRAYADCPLCVPARVGIMTGKFVYNHGMMTNGQTTGVIATEQSLPGLLQQAGYQTAAIGKMHFGPQRARHGFGEMILPADYYREMQYSALGSQPMRHGLGQNELYPSMATVPESQTLTAWIADQCALYIRERRDPTIPFFLWCSFSKPHPPLDPPEPYYSMYRHCPIPDAVHGAWSDDDVCPEPFQRFRQSWSLDKIPEEVIREARAAYYGLITQIDYNMGRVFAGLQDLGMFEDTMIIYTSDHGDLLGDHRSGAKTFFYEGSAHIPFVMRLPKSWADRQHGAEVNTPVTHADILPTILAAAGIRPPEDVDGLDLVSLARVARGDGAPTKRYIEAMYTTPDLEYYAITDGQWKYIWYPEGGAEQLFHLPSDPYEQNNVAACEGLVRHRLQQELVDRHTARGSGAVKNGKPIVRKPRGDSERDRRNCGWPGFHTEHFDIDVRH